MVVRKRLQLKGASLVFITTTVRNWSPIFSNEKLAHLTIKQLSKSTTCFNTTVIAYVLMPSHLHALIGMQQVEQLSKLMSNFKSFSARQILMAMTNEETEKFRNKNEYSIWKTRFDDLIIWSEEQFRIKIDYIHNNPVKAGLVGSAEGYVFSSATDWLKGETGLIDIDKGWSWQSAD